MSLLIIARRLQPPPAPEVCDYEIDVRVTVSPTELKVIEGPVILKGHIRGEGWPMLLAKFLLQEHPDVLRSVLERKSSCSSTQSPAASVDFNKDL